MSRTRILTILCCLAVAVPLSGGAAFSRPDKTEPPQHLVVKAAAPLRPAHASPQFRAWIQLVVWREATADNRPSGCPAGVECYRGGIRSRRPCAIPAWICERESRGWIDVGNPSSSAAGKYQFVDRTWRFAVSGAGYSGWAVGSAGLAPEWVQDAAAGWLWDRGRGCGHWAACS